MNKLIALLTCSLLFQSPLCFSKDSINIVILPDPYDCHQTGAEFTMSDKSVVGVLATSGCESDRPTYGSSNGKLGNTFSRLLIPWRYSTEGVFNNGYFMQMMIGAEKSEFRSEAGSAADVTFTDVGFYVGHQWFWRNGLNMSAMLGLAYLKQNHVDKRIVTSESGDVIDFLDKNTKTNAHPGLGVILGWTF